MANQPPGGLLPTVSPHDRENKYGHPSLILWFTGLSGSGKSTLAREVEARLFTRGLNSFVLDGDEIRAGLNRDLGFSPEDREENIRRLAEVAHLFTRAGFIIIAAFISPYRRDRDRARGKAPAGRFVEIYCRCPLEECERRDAKGLYRKARRGEIRDFTGVSAPYEEPLQPEIILDTDRESPLASADRILAFLEKHGLIPAASCAKER